MKLIADSGATKSDWILIQDSGEQMGFQLIGLNPYYLSTSETISILSKELTPFIEADKVDELYFYGAGCSSVYKCMMLEEAFQSLFRHSRISIGSDLLGTSRALFNTSDGIACILGTGSNACYFDGNTIVDKIISLGYFFGDEGSGAHMGKLFMREYLLEKVPRNIYESFKKKYNYSRDNILDAVYNLSFPNRFLAGFGEFFADNISDPYIRDLVSASFRDFFENQVTHLKDYKEKKVSFTGSVAFYFEPQLRKVAKEFEITIDQILRTPINALASFHS